MLYENIVRPILFGISRKDPERAHHLALTALQITGNIGVLRWLLTRYTKTDSPGLEREVFGLTFPNPIGLAAGFDKNGAAARGLATLGFGHIELGTITSLTQPGNPRPRIWRFPEQQALINAMGFNNLGAQAMAHNLRAAGKISVPVGISLGKSKVTLEGNMNAVVADYLTSLHALYPYGDYFAVNVSSPNTPGLRTLQGKEQLTTLLQSLIKEALRLGNGTRKPILVKFAPDLTFEALNEALQVCVDCGADGVIAGNTTTSRKGLPSSAPQQGGMSGKPLQEKALGIVEHIHKQVPTLPIIGIGGVFQPEDALQLFSAGASLVQVYTGFVYQGPFLARTINRGLERRRLTRVPS